MHVIIFIILLMFSEILVKIRGTLKHVVNELKYKIIFD